MIDKAVEYANRLEKQTIECPRGCLNPGVFFGYMAGYEEAQAEISDLQAENAELQQDFDDCYADYQDLGKTMVIECDRYEDEIQELKNEIAKLKDEK